MYNKADLEFSKEIIDNAEYLDEVNLATSSGSYAIISTYFYNDFYYACAGDNGFGDRCIYKCGILEDLKDVVKNIINIYYTNYNILSKSIEDIMIENMVNGKPAVFKQAYAIDGHNEVVNTVKEQVKKGNLKLIIIGGVA